MDFAAYHASWYVREDGSLWRINEDLKKSIPEIGTNVKRVLPISNRVMSTSDNDLACLMNDGTLSIYESFQNYEVSKNVKRVFRESFQETIAMTKEDGSLHFHRRAVRDLLKINTIQVKLPGGYIQGNRYDNDLFAIENNRLVTRKPMDYEKQNTQKVLIHCRDSSGTETQKVLTIKVKEKPEQPFGISLYQSRKLSEHAPKGTVVGELYAMDSDLDEKHIFSFDVHPRLKYPEEDRHKELRRYREPLPEMFNDTFTIGRTPAGRPVLITKKENLDYETHPNMSVYLKATDKHGLEFAQTVDIHLRDENERPSDIEISRPNIQKQREQLSIDPFSPGITTYDLKYTQSQSIPENVKAGTTVGELRAKVADKREALQFTLVDHSSGINNDNHFFQIVKQPTGQSYLVVSDEATFDQEKKPFVYVCVEVRDPENLISIEQLPIQIKPAFTIDLETKKITSTLEPGATIGKFVSNAADYKVQLTGILDVLSIREISMFLKGDGSVWKISERNSEGNSLPTNELIITYEPPSLKPGNFSFPNPLLKTQQKGFKFESNGKLDLEYKFKSNHLSKGTKVPLNIDAQRIQQMAKGHVVTYYIRDDGTLWRKRKYWKIYNDSKPSVPEPVRTNPSAILPNRTFNTFFRIIDNELRLAAPIPDGVNQMKIHVEAITGEFRIEEVYVIEVERESGFGI